MNTIAQPAHRRLASALIVLASLVAGSWAADALKRPGTNAVAAKVEPTREREKLANRIKHWEDNMKILNEALAQRKAAVQKECDVDLSEKEGDMFKYDWEGMKSPK